MDLVSRDGRAYPLVAGQTTIGRTPDNNIVVDLPAVSRCHAAVYWDGGQCFVTDLGSANGTTVNGQRISTSQWTPLPPGSVLGLAEQHWFVLSARRAAGQGPHDRTVPSRPPIAAGAWPGVPAPGASTFPPWAVAAAAGAVVLLLMLIAILSRSSAGSPFAAALASPSPSTAAATASPLPVTPEPVTPVPPVPPPATPVPLPDAVVAIGQLNLRGGPGIGYAIVGSLSQGDELDVTGQAYKCGWLKVTTPGGDVGWVSGQAKYVTLNLPCDQVPAAPIPPLPTPTPGPTPTADTRPKVRIPIQNDTGAVVSLTLDGPAHYQFDLPVGRSFIEVVPGTYSYTGKGCGGATKSGEEDLQAGASEWRWWCGAF